MYCHTKSQCDWKLQPSGFLLQEHITFDLIVHEFFFTVNEVYIKNINTPYAWAVGQDWSGSSALNFVSYPSLPHCGCNVWFLEGLQSLVGGFPERSGLLVSYYSSVLMKCFGSTPFPYPLRREFVKFSTVDSLCPLIYTSKLGGSKFKKVAVDEP